MDHLHSMFPSYDRGILCLMLEECHGVVADVVDIMSQTSAHLPTPPATVIERENDDESPLQIMKYMLQDFMPEDKIEAYLQGKSCSVESSAQHLQSVMNEILAYVSMSTTSEDDYKCATGAGAGGSQCQDINAGKELIASDTVSIVDLTSCDTDTDIDLDMLLFECSLQGDDTVLYDDIIPQLDFLQDSTQQFKEARQIVRSFFQHSGIGQNSRRNGAAVSDAMIDSALEMSKGSSMAGIPAVLNPDAAIGWICEERHGRVAR